MSDPPVTLWAFPQRNHRVKFGLYISYIIVTRFCPWFGKCLLGIYYTVSALNVRCHHWEVKKLALTL